MAKPKMCPWLGKPSQGGAEILPVPSPLPSARRQLGKTSAAREGGRGEIRPLAIASLHSLTARPFFVLIIYCVHCASYLTYNALFNLENNLLKDCREKKQKQKTKLRFQSHSTPKSMIRVLAITP